MSICVPPLFGQLFWSKMDHAKIYTAYLDFPRWELSVRGLGFFVAVLVCRGIDFSCACTRVGVQYSCIPLRELIIRGWCRFTSCLLWLESVSLLRAQCNDVGSPAVFYDLNPFPSWGPNVIRSGYWDGTRPAFISQYGLFPGPYFTLSNQRRKHTWHV